MPWTNPPLSRLQRLPRPSILPALSRLHRRRRPSLWRQVLERGRLAPVSTKTRQKISKRPGTESGPHNSLQIRDTSEAPGGSASIAAIVLFPTENIRGFSHPS